MAENYFHDAFPDQRPEEEQHRDSGQEFALKHRVKAKDVPIGMTFYGNYDSFNFNLESDERKMESGLHYHMTFYGPTEKFPIPPDMDVYVSKPELCGSMSTAGTMQEEFEKSVSAVDRMKPLQEQFNREMAAGAPDSFTTSCPGTCCDLVMHSYREDLLMLMILNLLTLDSMEAHLDAAQERELLQFLKKRAGE
jgi:hypothetical protein